MPLPLINIVSKEFSLLIMLRFSFVLFFPLVFCYVNIIHDIGMGICHRDRFGITTEKTIALRPLGLKFSILIEEGFFNINKFFYLAGQVGPK